ncbi:Ribosomal protein l19, partial [Globisporangium splendens]
MLATALKTFATSAARRTAASSASVLFSAQHALFSTEGPAAAVTAAVDAENVQKKRTKLKIPTKRAAALLQQLNAEVVEKSLTEKDIDEFKPGDSVEVQYLLSRSSGKVQRVKGVVLARRNRGTGSSFIIRNHIGGYGYEQKIFLHSPLLQSVKVLQEAFIHKGKKRVRRANLFYLRDKAPNFTTV